jgi:hypothetical protein
MHVLLFRSSIKHEILLMRHSCNNLTLTTMALDFVSQIKSAILFFSRKHEDQCMFDLILNLGSKLAKSAAL